MMTRRLFILGTGSAVAALAIGCQSKQGRTESEWPFPDDTAWLQTALDRGGHVTLNHGQVYRVSARPGERAALRIGSDTYLDLGGATLELAPNQRCAMIAQRSDVGRIRNVRIGNGVIVGNGTRQPVDFRSNIGITPTLYLMGCDGLELRNLEMRDTYMYAVYARGDGGVIDNLSIENAIGGGVHLNGARWHIDNVKVHNVTFFERVNCQGNPFIVSLRDSKIGSIYCKNYGFGVKFQDGCENITVDSIEAIGGPNNNDYLVKIQGKKGKAKNLPNRNIRIGNIIARNGPYSGLYIYYSEGVNIASYRGENNGRSYILDVKNRADVLIIDSDNIHFGKLRATGFPTHGLWLHDKTGRVSADLLELQAAGSSNANPVVIFSGTAVLGGTEYRPKDR